ncbi:unnamed protein product, partial [marine sediment metagenome]
PSQVDETNELGEEYGFVCADCDHELRYCGYRIETERELIDYLTISPEERRKKEKQYEELFAEDEEVIPPDLTFKYLRKSAASAASRTSSANPNEVKYLMGHSNGIENHYVYRASDLVKNVCQHIYQEYFSS